MAKLFMTSDDLHEMTGYKQHRGQTQWLADNGYNFDIRSDGRPNVLLQQVQERQCKNIEPKTMWEPDFSSLEE